MPGLSGGHLPVALADSGKSLTETQLGGSGHPGNSTVEVCLDLRTDLEAVELVIFHINTKPCGEGGETERCLSVEVNIVNHVMVLGDIIEEILGSGHALAGVEGEIVTDKSVQFDCGGLLLSG